MFCILHYRLIKINLLHIARSEQLEKLTLAHWKIEKIVILDLTFTCALQDRLVWRSYVTLTYKIISVTLTLMCVCVAGCLAFWCPCIEMCNAARAMGETKCVCCVSCGMFHHYAGLGLCLASMRTKTRTALGIRVSKPRILIGQLRRFQPLIGWRS